MINRFSIFIRSSYLFHAFRICRAAQIHFPAVRKLDISRTGPERSIFRLESDDFDLRAGGKRIPVPAQAEQNRGRTAFDSPSFGCSIGLWYVDLQPGMRVHSFHLDNL